MWCVNHWGKQKHKLRKRMTEELMTSFQQLTASWRKDSAIILIIAAQTTFIPCNVWLIHLAQLTGGFLILTRFIYDGIWMGILWCYNEKKCIWQQIWLSRAALSGNEPLIRFHSSECQASAYLTSPYYLENRGWRLLWVIAAALGSLICYWELKARLWLIESLLNQNLTDDCKRKDRQ